MGAPDRCVTITLGGTELELKYEAYELMTLTRISGKGVMTFISELKPAPNEDEQDTMLRTSDLANVVPVIVAGLASHPQFGKMGDAKLSRKVCELLDKEAEKTGQSILVAAGLAAAEIWPAFTLGCLPPGMSIEDAVAKDEEGEGEEGDRPLEDAPAGISAGAS